MIKIKAKQLLTKRYFGSFFVLASAFMLSLCGLALLVTAVVQGVFKKEILPFEMSALSKTVICAITGIVGLYLFALGRKIKAQRINGMIFSSHFSPSFKKTIQFLLMYTVKLLFTLCWMFVYLLPGALCTAFLIMSLSQGAIEKRILYCWISASAVLFLTGITFTFVTLERYSVWQQYLCQKESSVIQSLYKSIEKTQGRMAGIFLFKLSMAGWILSCVLIAPVVYVLPYYNIAVGLYSLSPETAKDEKKREEIPPAVFKVIRSL